MLGSTDDSPGHRAEPAAETVPRDAAGFSSGVKTALSSEDCCSAALHRHSSRVQERIVSLEGRPGGGPPKRASGRTFTSVGTNPRLPWEVFERDMKIGSGSLVATSNESTRAHWASPNGENQRIPRPCGDRRIESGEARSYSRDAIPLACSHARPSRCRSTDGQRAQPVDPAGGSRSRCRSHRSRCTTPSAAAVVRRGGGHRRQDTRRRRYSARLSDSRPT